MMTQQEAVTKWPFAASKQEDVRDATRMEATIAAHMMQARQYDTRSGPIGKLPAGKKLDNDEIALMRRQEVFDAIGDMGSEARDIALKLGVSTADVTQRLISMERLGLVRSENALGSGWKTRWKVWFKVDSVQTVKDIDKGTSPAMSETFGLVTTEWQSTRQIAESGGKNLSTVQYHLKRLFELGHIKKSDAWAVAMWRKSGG
jgi:DNA-binding MarR family transcriptional regulator